MMDERISFIDVNAKSRERRKERSVTATVAEKGEYIYIHLIFHSVCSNFIFCHVSRYVVKNNFPTKWGSNVKIKCFEQTVIVEP